MLSPPRFKIFMGTCIVCVTTARDSGWKTARRSVAHPALTTGHGIRMYSLVPDMWSVNSRGSRIVAGGWLAAWITFCLEMPRAVH